MFITLSGYKERCRTSNIIFFMKLTSNPYGAGGSPRSIKTRLMLVDAFCFFLWSLLISDPLSGISVTGRDNSQHSWQITTLRLVKQPRNICLSLYDCLAREEKSGYSFQKWILWRELGIMGECSDTLRALSRWSAGTPRAAPVCPPQQNI